MKGDRKLKAIYKALNSLWVANESIKEASAALVTGAKLPGLSKQCDAASDSVSEIAFALLKESENIVKTQGKT